MKKIFIVGLAVGVAASGLMAPASAAKKKKKPVATTLYMHGNGPVGEGFEFAIYVTEGRPMTMDATEPAAGPPKSMSYSFERGNPDCTGNSLFPSWEGKLTGTIVGDVKLQANFLAAPSTVIARLWNDVPFASCTSPAAGTDAFVAPVAEVQAEVPAGQNEVEIVFEDLNVKVLGNIIVELHQTNPTNQGRVLYDSSDFPTRLEFSCIPASGSACAP